MKKIVLVAFAGLLGLSAVSCNKCAECSVKENNYYSGEYCKGNAVKNLIYEDAKEECEALGGTFK
jgi:hypothetical protein